ncbi:MAG: 2-oxo acid dehydrogenase subunit E2 [Bacteriovoracaceae bacterium]|nr:2-oxo acid dehydrogenase subunit E2 [Bacteriovoracaceae bacterium]
MGYVQIKPLKKMPPFRKIAIGTWGRPTDPQIYGTIEIELTKAHEWKDKIRKSNPDCPKITVLHMVARAFGVVMEQYPDLNGYIRFGKIYLRKSVDAFFQVSVKHHSGRDDLSGIKITDINKKSVIDIASETMSKANKVRDKKNSALQKSAKMLSLFPGIVVKFLLWLTSFIGYTLNLKPLGMPEDSFGGLMLSNVGSLGLDTAYAPLVPYSRVPVVILLGKAKKRPVVVDDKVEIREIITLNATIDHRFCDGALLAKMAKGLHMVFENPEKYFQ